MSGISMYMPEPSPHRAEFANDEACRMEHYSPVIQVGGPVKPTRVAPKEKTNAVCFDDLPHTGRV